MSVPGQHERWMQVALEHARIGLRAGQSPFGAAIVRGGELVAAGHNEVWLRTDPTAHAEVVTLQRAAKARASISLSDCVMYTTCEPCPMCAAASHWARLADVYYGATIDDAQHAGFTELTLSCADVYRLGGSEVRLHPGLLQQECAALFHEWKARGGRAY